MALNAYLSVTGDTQGSIQGSVTQAGREDMIEVNAVYHEVISPTDPASGLPTGKRQHAPITIVKAIDKSTPGLFSALTQNENLAAVRLDFYQPTRTGQESQFYTIELLNARISGIRTEMLHNKYPENTQHPEYERISFAYQKIIVTWQDGGIVAEDDWETPVA